MTTQQMVKLGRSKLEILKAIIEFLEEKTDYIFISDFKEIGLDNPTALEYLYVFNFIAEYSSGNLKIEIQKVGRITLVKLKKK